MPEPSGRNDISAHSAQTQVLSVVVPVYCEEDSLDEMYRRLRAVLESLGPELGHEILFVDDGSTDATAAMLTAIADDDPNVRVVRFSRNFGHQVAISAGLDHAAGDAVVIIDGDLQDPPEVIPEFVEKWREGYKVVYGQRQRREGEGWFKRASASLFYRGLRRLSDTELPLDSGDFRLLDRQVVEALKELRESGRYLRGMISWVGFSQCPVLYDRDARYAGTTKYPLAKMVRFAMDGITSFSSKPLILCAQLGFIVTLVALVGALWVFIGHLIDPTVTIRGWSSIIVIVLFLGGVQLMSVGVLGAYVARVFIETKGRPLYVIAETTPSGRAESPVSEAAAPHTTASTQK